jgi:aminoacyl-tRNA hydrolase
MGSGSHAVRSGCAASSPRGASANTGWCWPAYSQAQAPVDLLVVHDDIDLGFARLRLQVGGGSGGHNGIRSLERSLGTRDFARLKVGVGRPPGRMDPADYVLKRFGKDERTEMDIVVADAADVIEQWLDDPARAQEQAARRHVD